MESRARGAPRQVESGRVVMNTTRCKYCNGVGYAACCHDPGCKDRSGCGDCWDICAWCHGHGVFFPDQIVHRLRELPEEYLDGFGYYH